MSASHSGLSRRRFLAFAASGAAGVLLVATGCSPAAAPTDTPAPAPTTAPQATAAPQPTAVPTPAATVAPKSNAPVKLILWAHDYQPMTDVIKAIITEYGTTKPNVTVEYSPVPVTDMLTKVPVFMAAGTPLDGYDMIDTSFTQFFQKNWFAPVVPESFGVTTQKEVYNMFWKFMMDPTTDQKGNVYGVPMNWAALCVWYVTQPFIDAGLDPTKPPTDWISFTDVAVKLTKKDAQGNILNAGWEQSYKSTEWCFKRLYPLIYQLGGTVITDDGKSCTLNSPEAIQSIQLYTDWTTKYKVSIDGFSPAGVNSNDLFYQGYTPMVASGAYQYPPIKQTKPDWTFHKEYDLMHWPQWPASQNKKPVVPLWGWNWVVGGPSKVPADMWEFFAFMLNEKHDADFAQKTGNLWVRQKPGGNPFGSDYPADMVAILSADYNNGVVVPRNAKFEQVSTIVLDMLQSIESGQQQVKAAADDATRKVDDLLAQA